MNETVLVTGGSRGIGAACARLFASRGYRTAIGYRKSREAALALAAEIGGVAVQADVTEAAQVERMFAEVRRQLGRIGVLVNNAGISEFSLFTDISEAQWDLMMDTNCKGMFLCAKEALKDMLPEKRGAIVNVSSMWGQTGASCEVHYSASKAAVIGLTKALAKELGPSCIRVNCVTPGAVETDMMAEVEEAVKKQLAEDAPLQRLGRPEDVARAVLFLASEDAGFITGQVIGVNGGFII